MKKEQQSFPVTDLFPSWLLVWLINYEW